MEDALKVIRGMVGLNGFYEANVANIATQRLAWSGTFYETYLGFIPVGVAVNSLIFLLIGLGFVVIRQKNTMELMSEPVDMGRMICSSLLLAAGMIVSLAGASSVFLYFNF